MVYRHTIDTTRLCHEHKGPRVDRVAHPEVPVFVIRNVGIKATADFIERSMKQQSVYRDVVPLAQPRKRKDAFKSSEQTACGFSITVGSVGGRKLEGIAISDR